MGMKRGFTSDILRSIYKEATRQGWRPEYGKGSNHAYVVCPHPECHYREAFSLSGRGLPKETGRKLSAMRRHGFVWKGRGGDHTADPLGGMKEKEKAPTQ